MRLKGLLLLLVTFSSVYSLKQVCYYTNWSASRPKEGHFTPADINPNLCTHIIFAYARIIGERIVPTGLSDETTQIVGFYERVTSLKYINPDLKVLLGVNGWNTRFHPDYTFGQVASANFVQETIAFLRQRDFDGIDLDWEYSSRRRGLPTSKDGFRELLQELHAGFEAEAKRTGKPRLLLSAAVTARRPDINERYDVATLARYLDLINVMSYDFHGPWKTTLGHSSPLHASSKQVGESAHFNTESALKHWLQLGVDRNKLVVGIPFYGRTFTVMRPNLTEIGDQDVGIGPAGPFTLENGFMAYYEICQLLRSGSTRIWHDEHKVPYLISGNTWVSYDDPQSVREKAKWIKSQALGGAMVWSLDLDDFTGHFCNRGRYPLLNEINSEFKNIQPVKTGLFEPEMDLVLGSWKSLSTGVGIDQQGQSTIQTKDGQITRPVGGADARVTRQNTVSGVGFGAGSTFKQGTVSVGNLGSEIQGQGMKPQMQLSGLEISGVDVSRDNVIDSGLGNIEGGQITRPVGGADARVTRIDTVSGVGFGADNTFRQGTVSAGNLVSEIQGQVIKPQIQPSGLEISGADVSRVNVIDSGLGNINVGQITRRVGGADARMTRIDTVSGVGFGADNTFRQGTVSAGNLVSEIQGQGIEPRIQPTGLEISGAGASTINVIDSGLGNINGGKSQGGMHVDTGLGSGFLHSFGSVSGEAGKRRVVEGHGDIRTDKMSVGKVKGTTATNDFQLTPAESKGSSQAGWKFSTDTGEFRPELRQTRTDIQGHTLGAEYPATGMEILQQETIGAGRKTSSKIEGALVGKDVQIGKASLRPTNGLAINNQLSKTTKVGVKTGLGDQSIADVSRPDLGMQNQRELESVIVTGGKGTGEFVTIDKLATKAGSEVMVPNQWGIETGIQPESAQSEWRSETSVQPIVDTQILGGKRTGIHVSQTGSEAGIQPGWGFETVMKQSDKSSVGKDTLGQDAMGASATKDVHIFKTVPESTLRNQLGVEAGTRLESGTESQWGFETAAIPPGDVFAEQTGTKVDIQGQGGMGSGINMDVGIKEIVKKDNFVTTAGSQGGIKSGLGFDTGGKQTGKLDIGLESFKMENQGQDALGTGASVAKDMRISETISEGRVQNQQGFQFDTRPNSGTKSQWGFETGAKPTGEFSADLSRTNIEIQGQGDKGVWHMTDGAIKEATAAKDAQIVRTTAESGIQPGWVFDADMNQSGKFGTGLQNAGFDNLGQDATGIMASATKGMQISEASSGGTVPYQWGLEAGVRPESALPAGKFTTDQSRIKVSIQGHEGKETGTGVKETFGPKSGIQSDMGIDVNTKQSGNFNVGVQKAGIGMQSQDGTVTRVGERIPPTTDVQFSETGSGGTVQNQWVVSTGMRRESGPQRHLEFETTALTAGEFSPDLARTQVDIQRQRELGTTGVTEGDIKGMVGKKGVHVSQTGLEGGFQLGPEFDKGMTQSDKINIGLKVAGLENQSKDGTGTGVFVTTDMKIPNSIPESTAQNQRGFEFVTRPESGTQNQWGLETGARPTAELGLKIAGLETQSKDGTGAGVFVTKDVQIPNSIPESTAQNQLGFEFGTRPESGTQNQWGLETGARPTAELGLKIAGLETQSKDGTGAGVFVTKDVQIPNSIPESTAQNQWGFEFGTRPESGTQNQWGLETGARPTAELGLKIAGLETQSKDGTGTGVFVTKDVQIPNSIQESTAQSQWGFEFGTRPESGAQNQWGLETGAQPTVEFSADLSGKNINIEGQGNTGTAQMSVGNVKGDIFNKAAHVTKASESEIQSAWGFGTDMKQKNQVSVGSQNAGINGRGTVTSVRKDARITRTGSAGTGPNQVGFEAVTGPERGAEFHWGTETGTRPSSKISPGLTGTKVIIQEQEGFRPGSITEGFIKDAAVKNDIHVIKTSSKGGIQSEFGIDTSIRRGGEFSTDLQPAGIDSLGQDGKVSVASVTKDGTMKTAASEGTVRNPWAFETAVQPKSDTALQWEFETGTRRAGEFSADVGRTMVDIHGQKAVVGDVATKTSAKGSMASKNMQAQKTSIGGEFPSDVLGGSVMGTTEIASGEINVATVRKEVPVDTAGSEGSVQLGFEPTFEFGVGLENGGMINQAHAKSKTVITGQELKRSSVTKDKNVVSTGKVKAEWGVEPGVQRSDGFSAEISRTGGLVQSSSGDIKGLASAVDTFGTPDAGTIIGMQSLHEKHILPPSEFGVEPAETDIRIQKPAVTGRTFLVSGHEINTPAAEKGIQVIKSEPDIHAGSLFETDAKLRLQGGVINDGSVMGNQIIGLSKEEKMLQRVGSSSHASSEISEKAFGRPFETKNTLQGGTGFSHTFVDEQAQGQMALEGGMLKPGVRRSELDSSGGFQGSSGRVQIVQDGSGSRNNEGGNMFQSGFSAKAQKQTRAQPAIAVLKGHQFPEALHGQIQTGSSTLGIIKSQRDIIQSDLQKTNVEMSHQVLDDSRFVSGRTHEDKRPAASQARFQWREDIPGSRLDLKVVKQSSSPENLSRMHSSGGAILPSDSQTRVRQNIRTVDKQQYPFGIQVKQSSGEAMFNQGNDISSVIGTKTISTRKHHTPVISSIFSWSSEAPDLVSEVHTEGNVLSTDLSSDRFKIHKTKPGIKQKSHFEEFGLRINELGSDFRGRNFGLNPPAAHTVDKTVTDTVTRLTLGEKNTVGSGFESQNLRKKAGNRLFVGEGPISLVVGKGENIKGINFEKADFQQLGTNMIKDTSVASQQHLKAPKGAMQIFDTTRAVNREMPFKQASAAAEAFSWSSTSQEPSLVINNEQKGMLTTVTKKLPKSASFTTQKAHASITGLEASQIGGAFQNEDGLVTQSFKSDVSHKKPIVKAEGFQPGGFQSTVIIVQPSSERAADKHTQRGESDFMGADKSGLLTQGLVASEVGGTVRNEDGSVPQDFRSGAGHIEPIATTKNFHAGGFQSKGSVVQPSFEKATNMQIQRGESKFIVTDKSGFLDQGLEASRVSGTARNADGSVTQLLRSQPGHTKEVAMTKSFQAGGFPSRGGVAQPSLELNPDIRIQGGGSNFMVADRSGLQAQGLETSQVRGAFQNEDGSVPQFFKSDAGHSKPITITNSFQAGGFHSKGSVVQPSTGLAAADGHIQGGVSNFIAADKGGFREASQVGGPVRNEDGSVPQFLQPSIENVADVQIQARKSNFKLADRSGFQAQGLEASKVGGTVRNEDGPGSQFFTSDPVHTKPNVITKQFQAGGFQSQGSVVQPSTVQAADMQIQSGESNFMVADKSGFRVQDTNTVNTNTQTSDMLLQSGNIKIVKPGNLAYPPQEAESAIMSTNLQIQNPEQHGITGNNAATGMRSSDAETNFITGIVNVRPVDNTQIHSQPALGGETSFMTRNQGQFGAEENRGNPGQPDITAIRFQGAKGTTLSTGVKDVSGMQSTSRGRQTLGSQASSNILTDTQTRGGEASFVPADAATDTHRSSEKSSFSWGIDAAAQASSEASIRTVTDGKLVPLISQGAVVGQSPGAQQMGETFNQQHSVESAIIIPGSQNVRDRRIIPFDAEGSTSITSNLQQTGGILTQQPSGSVVSSGLMSTGGHYLLDPIISLEPFTRSNGIQPSVLGINGGGASNSLNRLSVSTREFNTVAQPTRVRITGQHHNNINKNFVTAQRMRVSDPRAVSGTLHSNLLDGSAANRVGWVSGQTRRTGNSFEGIEASQSGTSNINCEPGSLICLNHINQVVVRANNGKDKVGVWKKAGSSNTMSKPRV